MLRWLLDKEGRLFRTRIRKPWVNFLWLFLFIALLKVTYVLLRGMSVQPDSYNYLVCIMNFDYPPVYPLFLRSVLSISNELMWVGVVQGTVFALAASLFLVMVCRHRKGAFILAGILAIDPVSGFYCASIMSEALFIPLLMVWMAMLYQLIKNQSVGGILLLGMLTGLMYCTRYAGILLVPFPVLFLLISKERRKRSVMMLVLLVAGFQLTILPMRLKYKQVFDTYQFNGFTGLNIWNSASVLWPTSDYQNDPQNEFEEFLAANEFPYTVKLAVDARQISDPELTHLSYVRATDRDFYDKPITNRELGETGRRLIMEQPFTYIGSFVIGNYAKPLIGSEHHVEANNLAYYEDEFGFDASGGTHYSHYGWWLCLLVLITASLVYFTEKRSSLAGLMVVFCWYYILVIPPLAAVSLRYLYMLAPFILLSISYPLLKNLKIGRSG